MSNGIKFTNWVYDGDKVKLNYEDNTSVLIQKTDFDRAFGNIIHISKEKLTKEYMHINC